MHVDASNASSNDDNNDNVNDDNDDDNDRRGANDPVAVAPSLQLESPGPGRPLIVARSINELGDGGYDSFLVRASLGVARSVVDFLFVQRYLQDFPRLAARARIALDPVDWDYIASLIQRDFLEL